MSLNQKIYDYLEEISLSKKIPHALLFVGGADSPKEIAAQAFAQQLIRSPHDLYTFRPEGAIGAHSMESMKRLIAEAELPPYEKGYKVFILYEAERMLATAGNALLKILEEPVETTIFLLLTKFPEKILPTLKSRVQILYFSIEGKKEEEESSLIEFLGNLHEASPLDMLQKVEELTQKIEKPVAEEVEEDEHEITAFQKGELEKEALGRQAIVQGERFEKLLTEVLYWYRDLHLLQVGADPVLLKHKNYQPKLQQWIERGSVPSLERIQKVIDRARQSQERSGGIKNTLESFFFALSKE